LHPLLTETRSPRHKMSGAGSKPGAKKETGLALKYKKVRAA
jgi:hypothetical protein